MCAVGWYQLILLKVCAVRWSELILLKVCAVGWYSLISLKLCAIGCSGLILLKVCSIGWYWLIVLKVCAIGWYCIHAYHYSSTVFVPENHENQSCILEIRLASQKFWILSFMKKTTANMAFPIFPKSS